MMLATCVIGMVNWARVLDKGGHAAERHRAVGDSEAADHADGHVVQVADEVHHRQE